MLLVKRRIAAVAAATLGVALATSVVAPAASAAPAPIAPSAFGMHYLGWGSHPYPSMPFRSARIQDMGVTWADLQPTKGRWNATALHRLDAIVRGFKNRHVQPLYTLGQTPAWARVACHHGSYPATTCAPRYTGLRSPWATYVRTLAKRYHSIYFSGWNEPNLRNGWNGSIATMARLQATAYTVIHNARTGDRLVSPSIAVTAGRPYRWLSTFFHATGGKRFDVFGVHLYPSDYSARHGFGPEWSIGALDRVKSLLRSNRIRRQIWDLEVNVGRYQYRTTTSRAFTGWAGAAMVARTYVLQLSRGVKRVFWYAADDRSWGGTWMEQSDFTTLTYAGRAERTAYQLLRGARPYGCSSSHGRWTCTFHLAGGRNMLVKWTTARAYYVRTPRHTTGLYNAVGGHRSIGAGKRLTITRTPLYVVGTFSI